MHYRTVVTSFTACILSASLASCSAGSTSTQVGRLEGADIVVGSTLAPASLDFTNTGGAAIPQALMGNVYETLVNINDDGELVPWLAEEWTTNADATLYTFRLREGVTFSNGDEFTAETAAFSINRVKNEWTNGLKKQMDVVERAEAVDKHTLEVELSRPSRRWLWSMTTLTGAMMTPSAMDALASAPVGTGPFIVDGFVPRESIILDARPDYWGAPAESGMAIRYYSDQISSVNALRTGDVDVVFGVQAPELIATLPDDFNVDVGPTNGEVLVSMNNARAPFDDPQIRRAVAHAVDRQAVSDVVYEGLSIDTGGAPVAPFDPWFTGHNYAPYDPEKARELIAQSRYPHPAITIKVPSRPYAENTAELLYSQLTKVGFDVSLESVEFPAVWLNDVMKAGDYQMSIISHVEARDLPTLFGSPDSYLHYDNPETRELLAAADAASTAEEQERLMTEAVATITESMGSLTVTNMPNIVFSAPGVRGVDARLISDSIDLRRLEKHS